MGENIHNILKCNVYWKQEIQSEFFHYVEQLCIYWYI